MSIKLNLTSDPSAEKIREPRGISLGIGETSTPTTTSAVSSLLDDSIVEDTVNTYTLAGASTQAEGMLVRANEMLAELDRQGELITRERLARERALQKQGAFQEALKYLAENGESSVAANALLVDSETAAYSSTDALFSERFADNLIAASFAAQDMEVDPEDAPDGPPVFDDGISAFLYEELQRQEITNRFIRDITRAQSELPLADPTFSQESLLGNFTEYLLPFVTQYRMGILNLEGLPGGNLEETVARLRSLPPEEFAVALQKELDDIGDNQTLKLQFLATLSDFKQIDGFLENIALGLDAPISTSVVGLRRLLGTVAGGTTNLGARIARATGNASAGVANNTAQLRAVVDGFKVVSPRELQDRIAEILPSAVDPRVLERNSVPNIAAGLQTALFDTFDVANVMRLPPAALEVAVRATRERLVQDIKNTNGILDENRLFDPLTQTFEYRVTLGRIDATAFVDETQARTYANLVYRLRPGSYDIVPYGQGRFAVQIRAGVNETLEKVREHMGKIGQPDAAPDFTAVQKVIINGITGRYSTPEEFFSDWERGNRHLAVFNAQRVGKVIKDLYAGVTSGLSRRDRPLLSAALTESNSTRSWMTRTELENFYRTRTGGRLMPESMWTSYLNAVRLNDFEFVLLNANVYKNKIRQGQESFTFVADTPLAFDGVRASTRSFDPNAHNIVVVETVGKRRTERTYKAGTVPAAEQQRIVDMLENQGYSLVRVGEPRAMEARYGRPVSFVIGKAPSVRPIAYAQVPYRAGGHSVYTGEYFIKQPYIDGDTYFGDTAFQVFRTEKAARETLARLELVRKAYLDFRAGKISGKDFRDILRANSAYGVREWFSMVRRQGKNGKTTGFVDTKIPFVVARNGQRAIDADASIRNYVSKSFLNDVDDDAYNLLNLNNRAYTGRRSDENLQRHTPTPQGFQNMGAPMLDPMRTMRRALQHAASLRVFSDYKQGAVDQWVRRNFRFFDEPTKELASTNPFAAFAQAGFSSVADKTQVARAQAEAFHIRELLGYNQNETLGRLYQVVREALGEKDTIVTTAVDYLANSSPVALLKAFAFHTKLGLLNPAQFFMQISSMLSAAAIAGPVIGAKAHSITYALRLALLRNDGLLDETIARRLGSFFKDTVKQEGAEDLLWGLRKIGALDMSGSLALLDEGSLLRIPNKTGERISEASALFFNEGERLVRINAFTIAYLEWSAKNAGKRLDEQSLASLMPRMSDLTFNMTRASNAGWQKGIVGVMTQFWAFQARFTEMLLGHRLKWAEKRRLVGANFALWGAAGVGGLTLYNMVTEVLKPALMERGIELEDTWGEVVMEGIVSSAVEYLTGVDVNVEERYGPAGLTTLSNIAEGAPFYEIFIGPSGQILRDTYNSGGPFIKMIGSAIWGSEEFDMATAAQTLYPILRNVSTFSNIEKAYTVIQTGKYLSRSGLTLATDLDPAYGWAAGLMGFTPDEVGEAFDQIHLLRNRSEYLDKVALQAREFFRDGMRLSLEGNEEAAKSMFAMSNLLIQSAEPTYEEMDRMMSTLWDPEMIGLADDVRENFRATFGPQQTMDDIILDTIGGM